MNVPMRGLLGAGAVIAVLAGAPAGAEGLILRGYVEPGPRVLLGTPGFRVPGYGRFPPPGYRAMPRIPAPIYRQGPRRELGPKAARAELRRTGFHRISAFERHGRNYRAEADYEGRRVEVVISARNGHILGITPIAARSAAARKPQRTQRAAPVREARLLVAPLPNPRPDALRAVSDTPPSVARSTDEPPRPRGRDAWFIN